MNGESSESLGEDANLLMLIQVPLKQKPQRRSKGIGIGYGYGGGILAESAPAASGGVSRSSSNVDTAVLGHGPSMGKYTELDGLSIKRDPRFPVRVTVQFYQATSNGVIDESDVARMAKQIDKVYSHADYVGSLVLPEGAKRPTLWDGATRAPDNLSWRDFAGLRERYEKYGWAGIVYRSDMVAGTEGDVPHPMMAVAVAGCRHLVGKIF